jgi:hypothetical protein
MSSPGIEHTHGLHELRGVGQLDHDRHAFFAEVIEARVRWVFRELISMGFQSIGWEQASKYPRQIAVPEWFAEDGAVARQ